MTKQIKKELKWGYSTGACATALALSAWHHLQSHELLTQIEVLFLDEKRVNIPLLPADLSPTAPLMRIQKDGGDDPDCTHNAILFASLQEAKKTDVTAEDYILSVGYDTLIVHAISGIGLCTRLGLDCEKGHWAINIGPRKMLTLNLQNAGMGSCVKSPKTWLFSLGVEEGAELAKHTLNSHLGIEGGISILGTTGHVRPYSHEAYAETVRICVRSNHLSSGNHMLFCTGGRTQNTAKNYFPHLMETSFVSIGDFIGESISAAHKYKMKHVTVACMGGKLCKYAAGFENTHAHNVEQDMQLLREQIILALNLNEKSDAISEQKNNHENLCLELQKAKSVREALVYLPHDVRLLVLAKLADKALAFFQSLSPEIEFGILLCDFNGDVIFEKRSPALQIKKKGKA